MIAEKRNLVFLFRSAGGENGFLKRPGMVDEFDQQVSTSMDGKPIFLHSGCLKISTQHQFIDRQRHHLTSAYKTTGLPGNRALVVLHVQLCQLVCKVWRACWHVLSQARLQCPAVAQHCSLV